MARKVCFTACAPSLGTPAQFTRWMKRDLPPADPPAHVHQ
jgi:hypothetical protein